jgi:UDP-N-acetylmuramoyl-L-alanyl-D-glutamate--2,6-diaminopimelate ligase
MKLKEFLPLKNAVLFGKDNVEIKGISYDSRTVKDGYAFFALHGSSVNGKNFIPQALSKGAALIVADEKLKNLPVPTIQADDVISFMSAFGAKFFNYPDKELKIIAVTGTNGKTTTAYMIESILVSAGKKCAVLGTINYRFNNKIFPAPNTTPQSIDLFKMMRDMVDAQVEYLIMEVSSHSLVLGRVAGIEFDAAIWTNLTQDHLDFHKDMDSYFAAKVKLFESLSKAGAVKPNKLAIINIDDDYGKKLLHLIDKSVKTVSYSLNSNSQADFEAQNISLSSSGGTFDLKTSVADIKAEIKHIGKHNIYNALAALAANISMGIKIEDAANALKEAAQAPGRLEKVGGDNLAFSVMVDYAHTDDALKNVLTALRALKPSRIITVFGCGGDRDRLKRPKMGEVASEFSDFVFITSDNPRTEDPDRIILDIEVGMKRQTSSSYKVVPDREEAIKAAIMMAGKGDIVLLAGKGHEDYQIVGKEKKHFDDKEIAQKHIAKKTSSKKPSKKSGQIFFDF